MDYRNYYPYSEYTSLRNQAGYGQGYGQAANQMPAQMYGQTPVQMPGQRSSQMPPQMNGQVSWQPPFNQDFRFPVSMDITDEEQMERDMEYLRSMYPDMAKRIQRYVDDECDKMEYDGSMMFDEYPDRTMLRKIGNDIYDKVNEEGGLEGDMPAGSESLNMNIPNMNTPDNSMSDMEPMNDSFNMSDEEMYALEYRGGRRPLRRDQNNPVRELIDVILFNEIFKRRCRHNRCRKRMYW